MKLGCRDRFKFIMIEGILRSETLRSTSTNDCRAQTMYFSQTFNATDLHSLLSGPWGGLAKRSLRSIPLPLQRPNDDDLSSALQLLPSLHVTLVEQLAAAQTLDISLTRSSLTRVCSGCLELMSLSRRILYAIGHSSMQGGNARSNGYAT